MTSPTDAKLLGAALNAAYKLADNPSPGQFIIAAFTVCAERAAKPTFEEFVNALVDGRSDGVRTGVIYRSVCNELCCGVQDLVDCTENLKDSYERLYGEQPEVKPKPKLSALAEEISRHYVAVSRAMREADPAAAVRESEAVLRKQFERMGLAHLIDWEDGS